MKAEVKTTTPDWAQGIQFGLKKITPEDAACMLAEKNKGNRPINRLHVEELAREMTSGRWQLNGDTICLNSERLLDGQHRLAAAVATGLAIWAFVIEGLPSGIFVTKDLAKRRSGGDTLGICGEKNAYRLSAALIMIDKYMTGRVEKSVKYLNAEIVELMGKYTEARESLQTSHDAKGLVPTSVLDACHYLFSKKDPDLATEFVEKICRGAGLKVGEPWYVLRERLMKNSIAKAKLSKPYLMALCIKAWNHARAGTQVRHLRWREEGAAVESFPVVR